MFRIGTLLFVPAYLTVVLYRPLAILNKDDSNPILMFGLCLKCFAATHETYILFYRSSGCQHVCFIFAFLPLNYLKCTFILAQFDTVVSHLVTLQSLSFWIIVSWIWYLSHIQFLIEELLTVTPPSAVGYANGIAQSMASLARCIGPVVGGYVSWSGFFFSDFALLKQTVLVRCGLWALQIIRRDITLVSLFVL